jgi:hypothetical protein
MRTTLAVAVVAGLAVGCGSAASAPSASPSGSERETSLRISYWSEGNDEQKTSDKPDDQWTLRCDPAGGSLPKDAEACRKLKTMKRPFAPPRKDLQCTQQFGGPQEAVISGTYLGDRVFARLSLTDGCQIARFKRLGFLIPGFRVSAPGS